MNVAGKAGSSTRAVALAGLTAALLIAQQVGAKAARDALFLSHFAPSALPMVMGGAAVLAIGTALVTGRWLSRVGPSRCVPWLFALHGAAFGLEFLAAARAPAQVAVVLYFHVASLGAVAASGFWSAINERFDPYTAKRVIGRIGAGATLGGVLGGLATERAGRVLPIAQLLLGFMLINVVLALGTWLLRDRAGTRTGSSDAGEPALLVLRRAPYLRDLALLVGLLAVADTVVEYVFKAEAGRALGSGEALLSFFALFYSVTALLTFVMQWALHRKVIERLGLGGAVALLPGAALLASAVAALSPGLGSAVFLRGASAVLESSLYRSGYELLFTPLAPSQKRATKALLDVAVARVGAIAGSALAIAALAFAPAFAHLLLVAACAVLCAAALVLSLRLHAGYVAQLAHSLRAGVVQLDPSEVLDPATRRTLAESSATLDRAELLRKIEALRSSVAPSEPAGELTGWPARAAALVSGEPARARAALAQPLVPELIAPVIALLANDALASPAAAALRPLAPRCTGQLLDALLDGERPLALRRRLPPILQAVDGERVQRGLFAALDDAELAVRARAAQALGAIAGRSGPGVLSEAQIFAAIRRELERGEQGEPVIELVFALLGVCLEREAVTLSLHAILGSDSRLRGTALEYLDNVLPADVRERLWPLLRAARSVHPKRPRQAIVEELLSSSAQLRPRVPTPPSDG